MNRKVIVQLIVTAYIVDMGADEQEKHHSESKNEMMVVFDREGSNFYKITVAPWW